MLLNYQYYKKKFKAKKYQCFVSQASTHQAKCCKTDSFYCYIERGNNSI